MAVRKIKSTWWVDFSFNHTRYRNRSPENSRAGALAHETALRQRIARGERIEEPKELTQRNVTLRKFSEQWFEDYVKPNNKYSEQLAKKWVLASSLVPFFGDMP